MRLYVDEDALEHALVEAFRANGFDVLTANDASNQGLSDPEQLEVAASLGRVIYTYNTRDFQRIHREWLGSGRSHAGIIVCNRQRWNVGEQLRRLRALSAELGDAMENRCEFLSNFPRP